MFASRQRYTGMEITAHSIKVAQLVRRDKAWEVNRCGRVPLPKGSVGLNFKESGVIDGGLFADTVKKAMQMLDGKTNSVGLAIPNELVKILLHQYKELPETEKDIEKLVVWQTGKAYRFPMDNVKIAYDVAGRKTDGTYQLLVAVGAKKAIREYETALDQLSIHTPVVRPAAIHLLNFYMPKLPHKGTFAFVGIFGHYVSFMIFDRGQLVFTRGIKKKVTPIGCYRDVNLMILHYLNTNPDKRFKRLYIASQVGSHQKIKKVFRDLSDLEIFILDEKTLIRVASDFTWTSDDFRLSYFASPIAAAQSLAE